MEIEWTVLAERAPTDGAIPNKRFSLLAAASVGQPLSHPVEDNGPVFPVKHFDVCLQRTLPAVDPRRSNIIRSRGQERGTHAGTVGRGKDSEGEKQQDACVVPTIFYLAPGLLSRKIKNGRFVYGTFPTMLSVPGDELVGTCCSRF